MTKREELARIVAGMYLRAGVLNPPAKPSSVAYERVDALMEPGEEALLTSTYHFGPADPRFRKMRTEESKVILKAILTHIKGRASRD